jgi:hypothetical protein
MNLIAGLLGNLGAICISDIPFCITTVSDAISGVIPLVGPAIHFIYNQIINVITQCLPTVFS